jgi:hypothetical protein
MAALQASKKLPAFQLRTGLAPISKVHPTNAYFWLKNVDIRARF